MRGWRWTASVLVLLGAFGMRSAHAGSLADVFRSRRFAGLGLAPLGELLATTVASGYPVGSAGSSVVYRYDLELDTHERRTGVAGPLFGERAETIGRGKANVAFTYSYVHFTTIDGDDLNALPSRRSVDRRVLKLSVPGGVTLADGRFTTFLPVRVTADIDVTAQQFALSATYGITPQLDVNLVVPVLHTSLDLAATGLAPDPRYTDLALPDGRSFTVEPSDSADATGIGDLLVRAKYLVHQETPVDVALILGIALPSGDPDDFQGSGTTRVQPALVLSRVFAERFEPFLNAGVDVNADYVDRSVVRWAVGGSADVVAGLTAVIAFLGRNELGAQAPPNPLPFFFQVERNDLYDAAIGVRWRFTENALVSADVLVPLNRDGLRTDAIPVVNVEYAF
jgi:hypothetical protein